MIKTFQGEVKFKLYFKSGGAIDFGTAMLKAAQMGKKRVLINHIKIQITKSSAESNAFPYLKHPI